MLPFALYIEDCSRKVNCCSTQNTFLIVCHLVPVDAHRCFLVSDININGTCIYAKEFIYVFVYLLSWQCLSSKLMTNIHQMTSIKDHPLAEKSRKIVLLYCASK